MEVLPGRCCGLMSLGEETEELQEWMRLSTGEAITDGDDGGLHGVEHWVAIFLYCVPVDATGC